MRFRHLPLGQRFTFQGVRYTKSSPLLASPEDGSAQRMFPQSAEVVVDETTAPAPGPTPTHIPRQVVESALAQHQRHCHRILADDTLEQARVQIDAALDELRHTLLSNAEPD